MKYVVISKLSPGKDGQELGAKLNPKAFSEIDKATKSGKLLQQADIEKLGVESNLAKLIADHINHLDRLTKDGSLVSGGPCEGFKDAINIFEATSEQEARSLHNADPFAKHGYLVVDKIYAWQQVF